MEQFSLDKWLQNKNRKVVTRRKNPVRIICWDRKHGGDDLPIVFLEKSNGGEFLSTCKSNGREGIFDTPYDLFFADEEEKLQSIEIPFGAKDSEFIKDEYYIPEGCEARIEGNKVIIEKIQKKEVSEFEIGLLDFADDWELVEVDSEKMDAVIHKHSQILLSLAKKEILKDLPKWKKDNNHLSSLTYQLDNRGDGNIFLCKKGYAIRLVELLNLPYES